MKKTNQEFVESLSPEDAKKILLDAVWALEKIAINSNPARNPPPTLAWNVLAKYGYYMTNVPETQGWHPNGFKS